MRDLSGLFIVSRTVGGTVAIQSSPSGNYDIRKKRLTRFNVKDRKSYIFAELRARSSSVQEGFETVGSGCGGLSSTPPRRRSRP